MAGGSALLKKKRPLVLGAVALVLALAIVALLVTKPWAGTKTRDDVAAPAAGDRVLQSVDVTVQGDGSLTRVGDTVVVARSSSGQADSYSTTYDPTKVVDQLPVRILTSYQTDKGSGTDLDDLEGYTGRVSINLSVQNLTVRPQEITYDSAGRSRTTTAQVGAPLTVVASAALPGIDPATVVTAATDATTAAGEDTGSTNGVLSRSQDGTTQVQWASILAPPQLSPTATFRVVLDAKDLVVPTVDVSVQPGLVTDPSVGALIDSAFNPKNSSELALETRTIKLIGDVNDVLGRASSTISGVRKTLDASSKTLGTKTVQSLTEDTKTISTSLKTSSDDIDALGDDLKGSLTTTQSATLQRMSETVSGLQDIIGDTSSTATASGGDGGCGAEIKTSGGGNGVYGNLQRVIAQLNEYAESTMVCKQDLQDQIAATIGPSDTTGCPAGDISPSSVVCSLVDAQRQFDSVTGNIADAQAAAKPLDPSSSSPAREFEDLSSNLSSLIDKLLGLKGDQSPTKVKSDVENAAEDLSAAQSRLDRLTSQIKTINANAGRNATAVGGMIDQNGDLADQLCLLEATGRLTSTEVERLRSYLVGDSCKAVDGSTTPIGPAPGHPQPMVTQLAAQQKAWSDLKAQTAPGSALVDGVESAQTNLGQIDVSIESARSRLAKSAATQQDIKEVLEDINEARKDADGDAENLNTFGAYVTDLTDRYNAAQSKLDAALKTAEDNSQAAAGTKVDAAIEKIIAQRTQTDEDLETAFNNSSKGLTDAASALGEQTARTLKQQRDDLAEQQKDDATSLDAQTKAGLSTISGSISSATRDIDSTRTTLTADLNNVLLDLGNPDQPGKGLLGTLGKSARAADSADYQLGLASDTVSSYSSVRSQEVDGILLRQAQAEAALQRQAELPAFATELPSNVQHRTVYLFHLGGDR